VAKRGVAAAANVNDFGTPVDVHNWFAPRLAAHAMHSFVRRLFEVSLARRVARQFPLSLIERTMPHWVGFSWNG
jgi:hypothetical protein